MRSWRLALVITWLLLGSLLQAAQVAFDYDTAPRTIRACQLLAPASNAHPYVLPVLARSPLKPAGWTFVNPLAPTQITQAIWDRWGGAYWASRGIAALTSPLCAAVPSEWPQYWEVVLSDDSLGDGVAEQLAQFDLIYLSSAEALNITRPAQIAGLRRAVENGAVLWIDNAGGAVTAFPVPRNSAGAPFAFGAMGGIVTTRARAGSGDPLLNYPYRLTDADVLQIGGNFPGFEVGPGSGANDVPLGPVVITSTDAPDAGWGVAAARYGQGAVVVTAEGGGRDIEAWYIGGAAQPNLVQQPDLLLAYNIAAYGHSAAQAGGGPAQRNLSFAAARLPLDLIWQFPPPWGDASLPSQPGPIAGSAVVSGGLVYVLSTVGADDRTPRLWCLRPGAYANGYQLVWSQPLLAGYTPRASSPQMAAVDVGGAAVPVVLVSAVNPATGVGAVSAYNATTGANLWNYGIGAYGGTAAVVDLSSPVACKNWLFVVATEYDSALQGGGVQGTYGRVWALNWSAAGPTVSWVYPDAARSEMQKLLPASHAPDWVANSNRTEIPPESDVRPAVVTSPRTPPGTPVEAALLVPAQARLEWDGSNITTVVAPSEYCLVPTPTDDAGAPLLNADYYTARLNSSGVTSVTSPATRDDGSPTPPALAVNPGAYTYDGADYALFNNVGGAPDGLLSFLATLSATSPYNNPLVLRSGCRVSISYSVGAANYSEVHFLPGPVAWSNTGSATPFHTSEHSGRTVASGTGVSVLDTESGRLVARWQPVGDSPLAAVTTSESPPAQEAETVWVASNARTGPEYLWRGTVHGVRTNPDLTVHLGPALADGVSVAPEATVTVTTLAGAPVSASTYQVDRASRVVSFQPSAGPTVAGKALLFSWTDSTGAPQTDFHVMPGLARFEYVGGFVRLRRYPVVVNTVSIALPDGSPLSIGPNPGQVHLGETTVTATIPGVGNVEVLPNGWLDFREATVTDNQGNTHSVVGREVLISYTGWSEPDYSPVNVGAGAIPAERQQVPVELGSNRSGVAVTGQAATVGSLGLGGTDASGDPIFVTPGGAENQYQTLLSLVWDPISHLVKGAAARPAYTYTDPNAAALTPLMPRVLGVPTSAGGRVYVGGVGVDSPVNADGSLRLDGPGWVGSLGPRRTLVCDGNRLVETTGSDRTWVLTGSQAYIYGRSAPEPLLGQPFSRPAKAAALADGTFLVVDTGNNRVIVVDRAGTQLWPLDEYGNDYYSSPARTDAAVPGGVAGNSNLKLAQPADAHRYVTPAGVVHTVIADTGHNRVLDVITTTLATGGQQHTVVELTPSHVRPAWDPTHRLQLRYVRAQPIFDFGNGNVVGYLCAATNIDRVVVVEAGTKYVNPDPTTTPPGGTRPWADWFPLYNAPRAVAPPVDQSNPLPPVLRFPNLRHVEYFRYGNRVYVLVVAGGMQDLQHGVSVEQDGVWVWEIDTTSGPVPAPGIPYLAPPTWWYTAADYAARTGAFGRVVTPAATYQKRFYPVCAKMLFPGRLYEGNVLITNYTGVMEHLARENVGGSPGSGLYGEIFEVNEAKALQWRRIIPDPFSRDWNDPLNQPAYAERY